MNSNNRKKLKNVYKPYNGISRELVLRIYKFTLKLRKESGYGQRTITEKIKREFGVNFSENTISGWIHRHIIPFANEKTQFKSKPVPPKKDLYDLYIKKKISASKIARKYKVSTIIAINWLVKCNIKPRTHTESMNTPNIKKELSDLKLTKPTKEYKKLSVEKAYILGVLCGDGYIDKKFAKLEIRRDKEFIEEFVRCFKEVYGLDYHYYYYKKRNTYISNINSQIICNDLLSHGKFRTKNWEVPEVILNTKSILVKSNFLRGLYDSDGYAAKYRVEITLLSSAAIESISRLLNQLSIQHRIYKNRKYTTLGIYKKTDRLIFKKLIGFTIKRKMEKLRW